MGTFSHVLIIDVSSSKEKFKTQISKSRPEVLYKKMFLEILQNSQESTCARVYFLSCRSKTCVLIKNRLRHRCFSVNFVKIFRTPFFIEHLQWLLLKKLKTNLFVFAWIYLQVLILIHHTNWLPVSSRSRILFCEYCF